ncbi:MAG: hypothetical protein ACPGVH_06125 [Chitinophagales bacterium]
MIAIITGDIIDSQQRDTKTWLKALKKALNKYGKEPTSWEIYRGDSFQLELDAKNALEKVIAIKAILKKEDIEVRMSIGIGKKDHTAKKITESNGSAFVNSGDCFETLKKNTLALKSPWKNFDEIINIMLDLALLTIDNWSATSAELVKIGLENPEKKQTELTKLLNKTQSTISEGFKRAGYDEILKMIDFYNKKIEEKC